MKNPFFLFLVCSIFCLNNMSAQDRMKKIDHLLQLLQKKYASDKRVAVFNITPKEADGKIVFYGELDRTATKNILFYEFKRQLNENVIDSIRMLPDAALQSDTCGFIVADVADVRRAPSDHAELVSQALMGEPITILKKEKTYFFVRLTDRYLGWIKNSSIKRCNGSVMQTWKDAQKVIVIKFQCAVRSKPQKDASAVCDVILGCVLKYDARMNGWTSVILSDGRKGFLPDSIVQDYDVWQKTRTLTPENLEKTARALLGIPYRWGGTTIKGMDCSGFTKMVYRLNGVELMRDANQQAGQGRFVRLDKDLRNIKKGDLLFFSKEAQNQRAPEIVHVGLYLGDKLFIHCSKQVRLCSLDPASRIFDGRLFKRLVRAQRMIMEKEE
jgi:SH3-like domain-containing protein